MKFDIKIVGLAIITLVLCWVLVNTLSSQSNLFEQFSMMNSQNIVEGMLSRNNVTGVETRAKAINNDASSIVSGMLLSEGDNRRNFEKLLVALNKWCDATSLSKLASNDLDTTKPFSSETQETIGYINNLKKLKETINDCVLFLDKQ